MARSHDPNPNPPFIVPPREHPEVTRARCRAYHRRIGTMDTFYQAYPDERPMRVERPDDGRGR